MGAAAGAASTRSPVASRFSGDLRWYALAVAVGSALIVTAAVKQPFSYDELTQMAPYGSDSRAEITGATRQPPLDPLLGALVQHLLGVGQLRQRLVPVLAGIGTLTVMSLLLHRYRLGRAGAFAVLVLATTPLMVRYSAYTRPYALPLFLMMLFGFAAQQWLDRKGLPWLGLAALAAVAMPLARVPEPTVFLLVAALTLTVFSLRGHLPWSRTLPLVAISLSALVAVGVPMYLTLAAEAESFYDPSTSAISDRVSRGMREMVFFMVPLLADWFPWWPVTAVAIVAAVGLPGSRRRLLGWFTWWPMLAAPVAFALAYHVTTSIPFYTLPYRARAAYFFVPAYILVIAALGSVVAERRTGRWLRAALSVVLAAVLLTQLPSTARVVLTDAAPDFDRISEVLTADLPDDAIVLYDRPAPVGQSRQPFLGSPRYMGATPYVETVSALATNADALPQNGPVYVLINGQCAAHGRCEPSTSPWVEDVPGWQIAHQLERFTLYEPTAGQDGRGGVIRALHAFGDVLGPELGFPVTFAAASLLVQQGSDARAEALVRRMYARAPTDIAEAIRGTGAAEQYRSLRAEAGGEQHSL